MTQPHLPIGLPTSHSRPPLRTAAARDTRSLWQTVKMAAARKQPRQAESARQRRCRGCVTPSCWTPGPPCLWRTCEGSASSCVVAWKQVGARVGPGCASSLYIDPIMQQVMTQHVSMERHIISCPDGGGFRVCAGANKCKLTSTTQVASLLSTWSRLECIQCRTFVLETGCVAWDAEGYTELFAVQAAVWQLTAGGASAAHDLCISAPTGSGKTLAYALPILAALQRWVTLG